MMLAVFKYILSRRLLFGLGCFGFSLSPALSQDLHETGHVVSLSNEVIFHVTDSRGNYITDKPATDFHVEIDGVFVPLKGQECDERHLKGRICIKNNDDGKGAIIASSDGSKKTTTRGRDFRSTFIGEPIYIATILDGSGSMGWDDGRKVFPALHLADSLSLGVENLPAIYRSTPELANVIWSWHSLFIFESELLDEDVEQARDQMDPLSYSNFIRRLDPWGIDYTDYSDDFPAMSEPNMDGVDELMFRPSPKNVQARYFRKGEYWNPELRPLLEKLEEEGTTDEIPQYFTGKTALFDAVRQAPKSILGGFRSNVNSIRDWAKGKSVEETLGTAFLCEARGAAVIVSDGTENMSAYSQAVATSRADDLTILNADGTRATTIPYIVVSVGSGSEPTDFLTEVAEVTDGKVFSLRDVGKGATEDIQKVKDYLTTEYAFWVPEEVLTGESELKICLNDDKNQPRNCQVYEPKGIAKTRKSRKRRKSGIQFVTQSRGRFGMYACREQDKTDEEAVVTAGAEIERMQELTSKGIELKESAKSISPADQRNFSEDWNAIQRSLGKMDRLVAVNFNQAMTEGGEEMLPRMKAANDEYSQEYENARKLLTKLETDRKVRRDTEYQTAKEAYEENRGLAEGIQAKFANDFTDEQKQANAELYTQATAPLTAGIGAIGRDFTLLEESNPKDKVAQLRVINNRYKLLIGEAQDAYQTFATRVREQEEQRAANASAAYMAKREEAKRLVSDLKGLTPEQREKNGVAILEIEQLLSEIGEISEDASPEDRATYAAKLETAKSKFKMVAHQLAVEDAEGSAAELELFESVTDEFEAFRDQFRGEISFAAVEDEFPAEVTIDREFSDQLKEMEEIHTQMLASGASIDDRKELRRRYEETLKEAKANFENLKAKIAAREVQRQQEIEAERQQQAQLEAEGKKSAIEKLVDDKFEEYRSKAKNFEALEEENADLIEKLKESNDGEYSVVQLFWDRAQEDFAEAEAQLNKTLQMSVNDSNFGIFHDEMNKALVQATEAEIPLDRALADLKVLIQKKKNESSDSPGDVENPGPNS